MYHLGSPAIMRLAFLASLGHASPLFLSSLLPDLDVPQLGGDLVGDKSQIEEQQTISSWWSVGSLFGNRSKSFKKQKSSHSLNSGSKYDSAEQAMTSYPATTLSMAPTYEPQPDILISVIFDSLTSALTVTILCLRNLPPKYNHQSVYVKAVLQPGNHQKQETQPADGSNPQFHECFYFNKVKESDLVSYHLTITAHKLHNHKVLGEVFLNLGLLEIEDGRSKYFWFPLLNHQRSRRVRV